MLLFMGTPIRHKHFLKLLQKLLCHGLVASHCLRPCCSTLCPRLWETKPCCTKIIKNKILLLLDEHVVKYTPIVKCSSSVLHGELLLPHKGICLDFRKQSSLVTHLLKPLFIISHHTLFLLGVKHNRINGNFCLVN